MNGWRLVTERDGATVEQALRVEIKREDDGALPPLEFSLTPAERERAARIRTHLRHQIARRNRVDTAHALGVALERLS